MRLITFTFLFIYTFSICTAQQNADTIAYDLYISQIAAAEASFQNHNVGEGKEMLAKCDPKFRNIEWKFLNAYSDQSSKSVGNENVAYNDIKTSPKGDKIAVACADGSIRMYDIDLNPMGKLMGHTNEATSIDFSSDGNFLVSGGKDHSIIIWDIKKRTLQLKIDTLFSKEIYQVKFIDGNNAVAAVSWENPTFGNIKVQGFAKIIDAKSGALKHKINLDQHPASGVLEIPKSNDLIISTWGELAGKYDKSTGQAAWQYNPISADEIGFQSNDLSKDGKVLWLGSSDHNIHVIETNTGALMTKIDASVGNNKAIRTIKFSHDGKWVATAGDDQTITIWSASDFSKKMDLVGHSNSITGLSWSYDDQTIYSASSDKTLKKWQLNDLPFKSYVVCDEGPWQTPMTNDQSFFVAPCTDEKLSIYELASAREIMTLGYERTISAAFSPDNSKLITGHLDGKVKLWDMSIAQLSTAFIGHASRVDGVAWLGKLNLGISVAGNKIYVWKTGQESPMHEMTTLHDAYRVNVGPNEETIIVGCHDGTLESYSTLTWEKTSTAKVDGSIQEMTVNHGYNMIAVFNGNQIELFEIPTWRHISSLKGHLSPGYGLGFSLDDSYLVSASYDQTIKMWNLQQDRCTLTFHGIDQNLYSSQFVDDHSLLIGTKEGKMSYFKW